MVVSISHFLCVCLGGKGAHQTKLCVYIHMQYDTHTNWRTEEERADRGGAKSKMVRKKYNEVAFFDFPSTPCGSMYARRGGVIWSWCCIWKTHGTHINESFHACEWVMAHAWMSQGTRMNDSWHACEWVMAHIWTSYGTHMSESWHTYEWVMARMWTSHGTYMNGSYHTYERVMAHICMIHDTHMNQA